MVQVPSLWDLMNAFPSSTTTSAISGLSETHSIEPALASSGLILRSTGVSMSRYALMADGTLKLVTGIAVTTTSTLAVMLSHLAVMTVLPGATPITRPFFTVATFSSSDDHSKMAVFAASSGTVVYFIRPVSPWTSVSLPDAGEVITICWRDPPTTFSFLHESTDIRDISTTVMAVRYRTRVFR